jgi:hypothetical protein
MLFLVGINLMKIKVYKNQHDLKVKIKISSSHPNNSKLLIIHILIPDKKSKLAILDKEIEYFSCLLVTNHKMIKGEFNA